MSPFLFLQIRRVKNALYRSFKTPVRGFMSVLLIGYFLMTLMMIFTLKEPKVKDGIGTLDMHFPIALLALAHLVPLLYTIPPPKYLYTVFSETDVANLYPAPLHPWRSFRFFLFTRTFAGYCLLFVVFAFYGSWALRLGLPGIFAHEADAHHLIWNILYIATILPALAGLLFWRLIIDLRREFNLISSHLFKIVVLFFFGIVVSEVVSSVVQAYQHGLDFRAGIVTSLETLPLSLMLVPFKTLAQLFLAYPDPSAVSFWIGIAFWMGLAGSGYSVLRSHHLHLYDYASRLTEFRALMATHMRSPAERLKEMKRSGKRVMRLPWFARIGNPRKATAVFWLDMVITWRSFGTAIKGLQGLFFVLVIAGWAALRYYGVQVKAPAVWRFSGVAMFLASWPLSIVSTLGFTEVLRRVEIQKPLPLSALDTVTMHILQWTAMTCSVTLVPFLTAFLLLGSVGYPILFVLVIGWSFLHCMISGFFLISLYNPDSADPIQRMYAMMFGLAISIGAALPGAAFLVVGILLHVPLLIVLILLILANLASAAALHYLSARKYADFVLTE
jgi:hypothetical protein